jgi:hypothetical protein
MTLNDPRKYNDPNRELDLAPGLVHVHWDLIEDTGKLDIESLKSQTRQAMLSHLQDL